MGERRLGYHPGDMSVPIGTVTQTLTPDMPRVSGFGLTIKRIDELAKRIHESDWTKAEALRIERDDLLIGFLSRGLLGNVPEGASVGFSHSEIDPDHKIKIIVNTPDLRRTYYLKDKAAKTPAQRAIVEKARAAIRSRG